MIFQSRALTWFNVYSLQKASAAYLKSSSSSNGSVMTVSFFWDFTWTIRKTANTLIAAKKIKWLQWLSAAHLQKKSNCFRLINIQEVLQNSRTFDTTFNLPIKWDCRCHFIALYRVSDLRKHKLMVWNFWLRSLLLLAIVFTRLVNTAIANE